MRLLWEHDISCAVLAPCFFPSASFPSGRGVRCGRGESFDPSPIYPLFLYKHIPRGGLGLFCPGQ